MQALLAHLKSNPLEHHKRIILPLLVEFLQRSLPLWACRAHIMAITAMDTLPSGILQARQSPSTP